MDDGLPGYWEAFADRWTALMRPLGDRRLRRGTARRLRSWGGELSRVAVETAEPIGRFTGFRPARTVTAWAAVRG
ncbi:MAG: hypothetical protein KIT69_01780 [Propionibacteriaceae bacterium]|nr:hypothetical protein [Propionibacteriaceae bacterium]